MKKYLFLIAFAFSPLAMASNVFEAYQVRVDKIDSPQIRFMDGSDAIIQDEPPIEIGYFDNVVVYRDGSSWFMCFDGDRYSLSNVDLPLDKKERNYLDINYNELDLLKECY